MAISHIIYPKNYYKYLTNRPFKVLQTCGIMMITHNLVLYQWFTIALKYLVLVEDYNL